MSAPPTRVVPSLFLPIASSSSSQAGGASSSSTARSSTMPSPIARTAGAASPTPAPTHGAEATLAVHIWCVPAASGSSALSRAPLLREVPQVRRKLTKRDSRAPPGSSGGLQPHHLHHQQIDEADAGWSTADREGAGKSGLGFAGIKGATGWLREKPSRTKLAMPSAEASGGKAGWKRATILFRDDGILSIFGEDRALLHSIHAPSLQTSDVRRVDDSLFTKPHVLGIFSLPSVFSTSGARTPAAATRTAHASSSNEALNASEKAARAEPIYLCFPSRAKLLRWRSLLRTFAEPELYGPSGSSTPTHRRYRQLDMTVFEARFPNTSRAPLPLPDYGRSHASSGKAKGLARRLRRREDEEAEDVVAFGDEPGHLNDLPPGAEVFGSPTAASISSPALAAEKQMSSLARFSASLRRSTSIDSFGPSENGRAGGSISPIAAGPGSDSEEEMSGPISGLTGAARTAATAAMPAGMPPSRSQRSLGETAGPSTAPTFTACYCLVLLDGAVVARTKVRASGTGSIVWVEKFCMAEVPSLSSLQVDVICSQRTGKYSLLGSVDIPIETMRRGEDVEGWFPIWAQRRVDDAAAANARSDLSYGREMIGELKMVIRVREETILARTKYQGVEKALNAPNCVSLVRALSKELEEDRLITHLVDIWTSSGTIVQRLADLADVESSAFGDKLEPELLFRGNTLLSRSLDKFQRLYCSGWLDVSVGSIVRRIVEERIWLEADEEASHRGMFSSDARPGTASGQAAGGESISTSMSRSSTHSSEGGPADASRGGALEQLKRLCVEVWESIYRNRHACPHDLRRALNHIRTTVNARFNGVKQPGPGFQGVGAFVFLRLICPAITTPHLYGLTAVAPDIRSAKTLMLIAKVFLALANKRPAFDKDKEPWLVQVNDFLRTQGAAFDDYITAVSTRPPEEMQSKSMPLGDENDYSLQRAVQRHMPKLPPLHRESIPTPTYLLDRPLALASLVSYVVRSAQLVRSDEETRSARSAATSQSEEVLADAPPQSAEAGAAAEADALANFVDLCCDIEEETGAEIDLAGFDPAPLPLPRGHLPGMDPRLATSASISTGRVTPVNGASGSGHNELRSSPGIITGSRSQTGSYQEPDASTVSFDRQGSAGRSRRATVSSRIPTKQAPPPFIEASPAPDITPRMPSVESMQASGDGGFSSTNLSLNLDEQSDDELRAAYQSFAASSSPAHRVPRSPVRVSPGNSGVVGRSADSVLRPMGRRHSSDTSRLTHSSRTTRGDRSSPAPVFEAGSGHVSRRSISSRTTAAHAGFASSDEESAAQHSVLSGTVTSGNSAKRTRKSWWRRAAGA